MQRTSLVFLAAVLSMACGMHDQQTKSCTVMGCNDGVGIDLGVLAARFPAVPLTVHICLDAACQDATVTATSCEQVQLPQSGPVPAVVLLCEPSNDGHVKILASSTSPLASTANVAVAVSVKDAMGAVVYEHAESVSLGSTQPNGPGCDPICHQGTLTLTP